MKFAAAFLLLAGRGHASEVGLFTLAAEGPPSREQMQCIIPKATQAMAGTGGGCDLHGQTSIQNVIDEETLCDCLYLELQKFPQVMRDCDVSVAAIGQTLAQGKAQYQAKCSNTATEPLGLVGQIRGRIEYETKLAETAPKNKIILAIIAMLGFGCCGVDRCYMGQTCLGVVKGLTGGGLVIWGIVDYLVILINCLSMSTSIKSVSFNSEFTSGSVMGGCIVCAVVLGIKLIGCVLRGAALKDMVSGGRVKVAEETPETSPADYAQLAA